MKIIEPSITIMTKINEENILKFLENIGRKAYKSEEKIGKNSAIKFISNIIKKGHLSVIEHFSISVLIICDRGVSHELVRHRLTSFTQTSTRYCNYNTDKFNKEITVISPYFWENNKNNKAYKLWEKAMRFSQETYNNLIDLGCSPQEARSVLPNSLATEIVITANLREWRHILELRCSPQAHPQMREIMLMILELFNQKLPVIFNDIYRKYNK